MVVVIIGVVAVVEGEVEDLGAALPAEAPRRHGGDPGHGTERGRGGRVARRGMRRRDVAFYDLPRSAATYSAGFHRQSTPRVVEE